MESRVTYRSRCSHLGLTLAKLQAQTRYSSGRRTSAAILNSLTLRRRLSTVPSQRSSSPCSPSYAWGFIGKRRHIVSTALWKGIRLFSAVVGIVIVKSANTRPVTASGMTQETGVRRAGQGWLKAEEPAGWLPSHP